MSYTYNDDPFKNFGQDDTDEQIKTALNVMKDKTEEEKEALSNLFSGLSSWGSYWDY